MTASLTTTSRSQLLKELAAELEAATIQCTTPDGKTSASFTIDRRHHATGARNSKRVVFIIPPGYRKLSFAYDVDARFSAGGSARWLNDDPHDGTIVLSAWADGFGYCKVSVSNVTAVKED
jgi:hypothetical protein